MRATALEAIDTTARQALTDMRRMLGVLGEGEARRADARPGPARRSARAGPLRRAGGRAVGRRESARALDPGLELSAYRIIQEALTNSLKHAGGGRARVTVRYEPTSLDIAIEDERGAGATPAVEPEHEGRGLVGMRERVAMFRGTFAAQPTPAGSSVTARPADREGAARLVSIRVLLVDDQQLVRTGLPDDPRRRGGDRGRRRGGERAGGGRGGRPLEPGRRRHGHPHAGDGRGRGDPSARGRRPTAGPRILVLTTFDADEHVVEALRAGASGFLLKDVPPADFVRAIRIVASGEALIAPSVTRRLLDRFARLSVPADETHAERICASSPSASARC